jgi:hypothetical protein
MATVKCWPNKEMHTVIVEVTQDSLHFEFELDLEEAPQVRQDLADAIAIVEDDWIGS